MNYVVFGGQYGSEGKASAGEFLAQRILESGRSLTVIGENGLNAGHTNTRWCSHIIPATGIFADRVLLGPDSVIDLDQLILESLQCPGVVYLHENAALYYPGDKFEERDLVKSIASTGSGTGSARVRKFFQRLSNATVGSFCWPSRIKVVDNHNWFRLIGDPGPKIFECSQGVLLDPNFGHYPFVTSRCTFPQVAVARNGCSSIHWTYCGVFRTYPIRVGGPSGPCDGAEITWESLGVPPEITTVSKRVRRVFNFSASEFELTRRLVPSGVTLFTHVDYLKEPFPVWLKRFSISIPGEIWHSSETGKFTKFQ